MITFYHQWLFEDVRELKRVCYTLQNLTINRDHPISDQCQFMLLCKERLELIERCIYNLKRIQEILIGVGSSS